jgi:hypothetical protein
MSTSSQIIDLRPFEPARIGFRQARGLPLNCDFTFVEDKQPFDIAAVYPQLVLRPRSRSGANGYAMTIVDAINGSARVDIPGPNVSDPNGYAAEVYFRTATGQPTRMVAEGRLVYTGQAYQTEGPLGPASYPTGPSGPQGIPGQPGAPGADSTVPGPQGQRGSQWFTGEGPPPGGSLDYIEGDMWLDMLSGDVWRFDQSTGTWHLK